MQDKILICLCLGVLTAVQAQKIIESNYVTPNSKHYRSEDGLGNYNFGYDIENGDSGSFRRESGNAQGVKQGSYGIKEANGRVRVVNWIADSFGFRVSIRTNEPGVTASSPADASFNGAPFVYSKDTVDAPLPSENEVDNYSVPQNSIEDTQTYQRAPAVNAKPVFGARKRYVAEAPEVDTVEAGASAVSSRPYPTYYSWNGGSRRRS